MIRVVLNNEQASVAENAAGAVELHNPQGRVIGYVSRPLRQEEIAAAKRRLESSGLWHTTQQVLTHLQTLEQG